MYPIDEIWSEFTKQGNYIDNLTQLAFTCPKLTIETLEQVVKYVQS